MKRLKRPLSILLSVAVLLQMGLTPAFASEGAALGTSAVCPHHVHDESCGYTEAAPCAFDPADCALCTPADSGTSAQVVTEFASLDETAALQSVPAGTGRAALDLPDTLMANLEGAEGAQPVTGVTWAEDETCSDPAAYDEAAETGAYVFTAVLPEGFTLAEGVSLPEINVMVEARAVAMSAGYDIALDSVTISGDDGCSADAPHSITGESTSNTITVDGGTHFIELNRVNIIVADQDEACAFELKNSAEVHLTLIDTNIFYSGSKRAGIQVQENEAITITGAHNGRIETVSIYGAGIGGSAGKAGGLINITGGTVWAVSGIAAGIGGGQYGDGGRINITGGEVRVGSSGSAAAIGGGGGDDDGAAGSGSTINITGGVVHAINDALGGGLGGGIGGGSSESGGSGGGDPIGNGAHGAGGTVSRTKGVIFEGDAGKVYGAANLPSNSYDTLNMEFPTGKTLTIESGETLIIPWNSTLTIAPGATITNSGTIVVYGTLHSGAPTYGTITGSGKVKQYHAGEGFAYDIDSKTLTIHTNEGTTNWQMTGTFYEAIREGVTTVVMTDGVTEIGERAFNSCFKLTSVTIPASVKTIKKMAFYHCTGLTDITIPDGVTTIENNAFAYSGLTSVIIPDGITKIEEEGFYGCTKLATATLPASVTEIGDGAFQSCQVLRTLNITSTVPRVGTDAFGGYIPSTGGDRDLHYVASDGTALTGDALDVCINKFKNDETIGAVEDDKWYGWNIVPSIYKITASAGPGGSISPAGVLTVKKGESKTFTITPDSNYEIKTIHIDGINQADAFNTFTFQNIESNHEISVVFGRTSGGGSGGDGGSSSDSSGGSSSGSTQTGYPLTNGSAAVSRSSLQALAQAGKSLTISGGNASLVFDKAAVRAIVSGTTGKVTFSVTKANLSQFPDALAAIGARPAFTLTAKDADGKTVTDFGKGSVSISIPYTPAASEKPGNLYCVYVDNSGKVEWLTGSSYDSNAKALRFSTSHFSVYGFGYRVSTAFADVGSHWAKDDIDFVVARGLFNGTSATTFSPDTSMTRGMFVTALHRCATDSLLRRRRQMGGTKRHRQRHQRHHL